jgi:hypothetical protein
VLGTNIPANILIQKHNPSDDLSRFPVTSFTPLTLSPLS